MHQQEWGHLVHYQQVLAQPWSWQSKQPSQVMHSVPRRVAGKFCRSANEMHGRFSAACTGVCSSVARGRPCWILLPRHQGVLRWV